MVHCDTPTSLLSRKEGGPRVGTAVTIALEAQIKMTTTSIWPVSAFPWMRFP